MMYEQEIYEMIIEKMREKYEIEDEDKIYKYVKVKFLIMHNENKTVTNLLFINFLLSELNITTINGSYFIYKGEKIKLLSTMQNILENMDFRASLLDEEDIWSIDMNSKKLSLNEFIHKVFDEVTKIGEKLALKEVKKIEYIYMTYFKYYSLMELNRLFQAKDNYIKDIPQIEYPAHHNPYKRTVEEELSMLIEHYELYIRKDFNIQEKDVESYLVRNLDKIEVGLKFIDSQFRVREGIIDILAKDKHGKVVVIELKTEKDKKLVWQCMHYPEEIKRIYNIDDVRMITVAPEYDDSIKKILLGNAEMKEYDLEIRKGKIRDMLIRDIEN